MSTPVASVSHLNDTTPAAPTGTRNVKWQQGSPYPGTVTYMGITYDVTFTDISADFPNIGGVDARTTTTETVALASQGKLVTFTNASPVAVALTSSAFASGALLALSCLGVGTATITPSSGTINGASTLALTTGQSCWILFDGTNWQIIAGISTNGTVTGPGSSTDSDFVQFNGTSGLVIKDGGLSKTTDGTLAANSDSLIPSEKAVKTYIDANGRLSVPGVVGITVDGGGSTITTGVKGYAQIPYAGTIVGWSVLADQAGSINVDIDKHASSAPPTAPSIPNTSTDKISASAPVALSSAQSAAVAASGVSTWTTAVAQWDTFGFNVTSASVVTRVTILLEIARS